MRRILMVFTMCTLATIIGICIAGNNINPMLVVMDSVESNELTPAKYNIDVLANSKYYGTMMEFLPCTYMQEDNISNLATMPIYDIPLDEDIQQYLYLKCKEYEVPYELAIALIKAESNFKVDLVCTNNNSSQDSGLMQINSVHKEDYQKQGIANILDPYQNIDFGIALLADLCKKYNDEHRILMAYNFGENGARKVVSRGITSSKYSRRVIEYKNNLIKCDN